MKTIIYSVFLLLLFTNTQNALPPHHSQIPLVLISIDGLKPDYVLEAERYNLKIPHLRRFLREGVYAKAVTGVLPTLTYPSHTTIVTGVYPNQHGILSNTPFDPLGKNMNGWYWYAQDIKVPTLWDAATSAGLTTASVDWPVTVGANITHNIVQYWRTGTPDDLKLIRALSTKGLLAEAESVLGKYPDGYAYDLAADQRRALFSIYLLEKKKPHLLTCYFAALDTIQHDKGPYSQEAFIALEEIDKLIGDIRSAASKNGNGQAIICIVSDHGFIATHTEIHINSAMRAADLIQLDQLGSVKSWQAYAWPANGLVAIMLQNPQDKAVHQKVKALLQRLTNDPESSIYKVLEEGEINDLKGFSGASFVVCAKPGFRFGRKLIGEVITKGELAGAHGYLPELNSMDASFFLAGAHVPVGRQLERIDMCDIAPTLAALLEIKLPSAQGRNLLLGEKH
jgi:predicted AlkP superfamily pyrophosphatase or phosphodiesterase